MQKKQYHHGDLRGSLLNAARLMIREQGIDAVSMRKLADKVGVSRTALYHHFAGKHELLCALAEEGFHRYSQKANKLLTDMHLNTEERFALHVRSYVEFAIENPEYYDLMFGRTIWKSEAPTDTLKEQAYSVFRYYSQAVNDWQQQGLLPADLDTLRFAQVSWSMLHGISRLIIDGIYADGEAMEGMCQMAAKVILNNFVME